jgi:glutathione S-transferase
VKSLGGRATEKKPDGTPYYTLPAIHDPNTNTFVTDSLDIAVYLDKTYPSAPSLLRGAPALHAAFVDAFMAETKNMFPLCIPLIPPRLNPVSQEYYWVSRRQMLGKPLQDWLPKGDDLQKAWKELEDGYGRVANWYKNDETLIGGDQPVFSDACVAGFLYSVRWVYGAESKEWAMIKQWHGGRWARVLERMKQYEQ